MARSPIRESISVVIGPTVLPDPIEVLPRRDVPGRMVASGSMLTSASIQVAPGSSIVTPARMWAMEDPAARLVGDAGEVGAVVDPRFTAGSATRCAITLPPSSRISGRTSGR